MDAVLKYLQKVEEYLGCHVLLSSAHIEFSSDVCGEAWVVVENIEMNAQL